MTGKATVSRETSTLEHFVSHSRAKKKSRRPGLFSCTGVNSRERQASSRKHLSNYQGLRALFHGRGGSPSTAHDISSSLPDTREPATLGKTLAAIERGKKEPETHSEYHALINTWETSTTVSPWRFQPTCAAPQTPASLATGKILHGPVPALKAQASRRNRILFLLCNT